MATRIDVVSVFRKNTIRPAKFKYGGRTHRVEKILYNWVTREGSFPVHHFTVVTRDENRYEITFSTYTTEWNIEDSDSVAPDGVVKADRQKRLLKG